MTRSRDVSKGATRNEFIYTTTQTTFSGNDDNSNSLSYTVGQIDVFMNGVDYLDFKQPMEHQSY